MPAHAPPEKRQQPARKVKQERAAGRDNRNAEKGKRARTELTILSAAADDARGIVVDIDIANLRNDVSNELFLYLTMHGGDSVRHASDWVHKHMAWGLGQPWKEAKLTAFGEAQRRFAHLGLSIGAWELAVSLRAFAALLERVTDRLLIDIGWVRARLAEGMDYNKIYLTILERHKRILKSELDAVWPMLIEFYNQGAGSDRLQRPTRKEFVYTSVPPALKRHDFMHPVKPLPAGRRQNGFPPVPRSPLGVIK